MKKCPVCHSEYFDDSLNFCLSDGATLVSVSGGDQTLQMPAEQNPARVNASPDSVPTVFPPAHSAQTARRGISPTIVFSLFGFLFLFAVALLGYIFLKPSNVSITNQNSPTPAVSRTPDAETAALKEEVENLKKQVEEQKNRKSAAPIPSPTQNQPPVTSIGTNARVDSPNDGFLALRISPDADAGERITQIPHNATVKVVSCQTKITKVSNRTGRWCQLEYRGTRGWAFDGWLIYLPQHGQ